VEKNKVISFFFNKNSNRYWSAGLILFAILWGLLFSKLANNPTELFVAHWPYIIIGFFGAILGNISAVGGGIVFIPTMVLIYHHPPVIALKIAILSQCFGMTSGAISWYSKVKIPKTIYMLTIPSLLLGSCISSFVFHPSALLVKVLFGPVSVLIGLITLYSLKLNQKESNTEFNLSPKDKILLMLMAFLGGLVTGWIAIGEGEIVSAFLMIFSNISSTLSIALGVTLLSINSLFLGIVHQFFLDGLPWNIAAFTGLGCVFGARLAPRIATVIHPKKLKIIFAAIAIVDGLVFIFQFLLSK
jgi:uncharacterized membrane protein YfcA